MDENNLCQLVSIFDDLRIFDLLTKRPQIVDSYRGLDALFKDAKRNLSDFEYGENLDENVDYLRKHLDSCTPCFDEYKIKYKDLLKMFVLRDIVE